jgi:flagellar hook-associated protein 3 FlgL
MISSLNPAAQQFLDNLNNVSTRMQQAQQRISTGTKINQVSDDPDSVSLLLQARASLASTQQINENLSRVKTEVDSAEQAMQSAVQLFDKVQTLGAQGNTDAQTASGRNALADELDSVLQQFVGLAGTAVEGRYIFSGDADQQVPYTYTAGQANPISAYLGSTSTRLVEHPNGTTFSVAHTAQEIFDSADPTKNLFSAVQQLSAALRANGTSTIATACSGLKPVADHLNSELAMYGTTQNKIAAATDFGQTLETQFKTQIGNLQDADLTQAILDLTQSQTQQQAALQSRAMLPRTTLFDYFK